LAELEKVKNALPSLLVSIGASEDSETSNRAAYALEHVVIPDTETEMDRIRSRYPHKSEGQPSPDVIQRSKLLLSMMTPSKEEYARYNREVDAYLQDYSTFIVARNDYLSMKSRSIRMYFRLVNNGGAPAEDVDIHLHFPDGFELYGPGDFISPPTDIKPPTPPRSQQAIVSSRWSGLNTYAGPTFRLPNIGPPPNVSSPKIQKTNSYDVRYCVMKLKHGYETPIGTLDVVFPSVESAKGFQINYTCTAANMPQARAGSLSVILARAQE
jgi:hypothetical protein